MAKMSKITLERLAQMMASSFVELGVHVDALETTMNKQFAQVHGELEDVRNDIRALREDVHVNDTRITRLEKKLGF